MDGPGATAVVLGTVTKILLWPAYHSTDMEVHRNWLALTSSLPLQKWYIDTTSPWTLDYPPFFAYLSWILAQPAKWIDPRIVNLENLNYAAWSCKAYMRATVLVTELVLAVAVYAYAQPSLAHDTDRMLFISILLHPGLLIVDHIHFQYNGFLFGIMLWSLYFARTKRPLWCAVFFASLLNFKHIYVYVAPAYVIYLLRAYLLPELPRDTKQVKGFFLRVASLGFSTLAPFIVSFGPFAVSSAGNLGPTTAFQAIFHRLFPFHRGLIHAYWAPNVWALYTATDRVLLMLKGHAPTPSTSRGIVGDTNLGVLPNISPTVCFLLAMIFSALYTVRLWQRPSYRALLVCITLCALTSFAIGWHVHEKAILMAVIPLSMAASYSYDYFRAWEILTAVSIVSLFPLLHQPLETPIKIAYSAIWFFILRHALRKRILRPMSSNAGVILHFFETQYLSGLALLACITEVIWPLTLTAAPRFASPRIESRLGLASSFYHVLV
ncbi:dolichyl-P-Glc:Glc1Man9GlcNAc2-PP-dolichol alpha-1,3-glucosyltransferase [Malassezia psittaci]|uniref:Alpha-1,3-glucosyltransferase n=1 Tax=Malassezia psittaci TaxID=1821823 RepID=A0AAF0JC69_9BASI|nr:dolichyl-P-Glc:Glc1Man9GlcNAc2-PP-dolichol alpha-1,3-glucosyltransferase [Malassezia psittaci]